MSKVVDAGTLRMIVDANAAGLSKALKLADKQVAAFSKTGAANIGKFQKAAALGFAAIGVAAIAATANLAKLGVKFEEVEFIIRKATGATGKDLDALTDSMKRVYATVEAGSAEVAQALGDLNTRTGQTGESLERLTKSMIDLADVSGEELSGLIVATTRLFGDWSVATDKQSQSLDWLWKVSQSTGIGIAQLSQLVTQTGAPLRELGFGFETATALMGKWEKEGVNVSAILGSLKIGLARMAKEGFATAEEGLAELMRLIEEAPKGLDAVAIAVDIFGSRAAADFALAVREGRFEVDDFLKSLRESPETIAKAETATDTLRDKWTTLVHQMEIKLAPAAERVLEHITEVFDGMVETAEEDGWGTAVGEVVGDAIGTAAKAAIEEAGPFVIEVGWKFVWGLTKGLLNAPQAMAEGLAGDSSWFWRSVEDQADEWSRDIRDRANQQGQTLSEAYADALESGWRFGWQYALSDEPDIAVEVARLLGVPLDPETMGKGIADVITRQEDAVRKALESQIRGQERPSLLTPGAFGIAGMDWEAFASDVEKPVTPLGDVAQAVDYTAENLKALSDAYGKTSEVDAWTQAVEASAEAAGISASEFDAATTSLSKYIEQLKAEYDAIVNQQSNLDTLMTRLGKSGALTQFADRGWDVGAVQNILIEKAAEKGPEILEALVGADDATVRDVIQQWMNLIWLESEGQKTQLIEQNRMLGESAREGYEEGLTRDLSGSGYDVILEHIRDAQANREAGKSAAENVNAGMDSEAEKIPSIVEKHLGEIDGKPSGEDIGDDLISGIESKFAMWKPGTVTIPLAFSWGAPAGGMDLQGLIAGDAFGGMARSTSDVWRTVKTMFPSSVWMGGFATSGHVPGSDHYTGHAFDVGGSPAQMKAIAQTLAAHFDSWGIKQIIHDRMQYRGSGWYPYKGENPHTGHVHVGTYDVGGLLPPGRTLATNYTGGYEVVLPADWIDSLTAQISALVDTSEDLISAFAERSRTASSYISREGSRYAMYEAEGAPLELLEQTLMDQITFIERAVVEAQAQLDAAKARGLPAEEINELAANLFDLRRDAAGAKEELADLADEAERAARADLEDAIDGWAESLSHLSSLSRLYSYHSGSGGFLDALLPQQLGLLGNQYQNYMALGDSTGAIAALTEMFDLEREAIERGFADEIAAVEQGGNARADAMRASVDALSDLLSDMRDEHQTELDDLRDYYDAKLALMDEEERELARRATASELASLYGAASKTTSDVARIQALREQQAKDERDERRRALTDARDAAIESLKSQQEAEEKRLQAQIDYQNKAMEQARRQAEAAHNAQLAALEKSQQQQLDLLVERYAELIGIAMGTAEQITGAAVHAAGGTSTGTAGGTWSTVGSTPSVPAGSTPSVPTGSTPSSTPDRRPGETLMEYLYRVNGAPGGENVIYGDGSWDPEYQWNPFIGAYEPVGSYTGSTYASNDWWRQYDQGGWLMPGKTLAVNNTGQPERVLAPNQGLQIGGEVTVRLVTDGPVTVTQEVADRLCEQVSRQLGRAQYNARYLN